MECDCGGVLIEGRSCYNAGNEHFYLLIEDLPAFRCTRCGKVLFQDETVEKIKKIVKRLERESAELVTGKSSVHSYDY